MSNQDIELKGSLFTLSVLHLHTSDFSLLAKALDAKISQAPSFFQSAPVVVNLSQLDGTSLDFQQLKSVLEAHQLVMVGITAANEEQKLAAKAAGCAVLKASKPQAKTQATPVDQAKAKIVETTVRSGQQIYAKGGDLIILGSVSNGAEVIADGNVHVYGTLRGRAIAGASGNAEARVFCRNLQAELISIAGNYWLSDTIKAQLWQQPAQIGLKKDALHISPLE